MQLTKFTNRMGFISYFLKEYHGKARSHGAPNVGD